MDNRGTRIYKMDNLKVLLIFMVVFGHMLEGFGGQIRTWLYLVIYSFHMPAFAYVTGYFIRFDVERLIQKIVYPYLFYQVAYLLFQRFFLLQENLIQFTTPYWLLWYLVAIGIWMLLVPVIDSDKFNKTIGLRMAFLCALLVGFDRSVGYYLSLSRTVVLFPFFMLGHYRIFDNKAISVKNKLPLCTIIILISIFYIMRGSSNIQAGWLYHSIPYEDEFSIVYRAAIIGVAIAWIAFLTKVMPNREIAFVTSIGKYTLPIFLLHGFLVKWMIKIQLFQWKESINIAVAFVLSVIICVCLGNKMVVQILSFSFSSNWKTWIRRLDDGR